MKNILEGFGVLKETGVKLWPYFTPSCKNLARSTALFTALGMPIVSNIVINAVFLTNDTDTETDNEPKDFNAITTFASVITMSLFTGAQYAISTFLTTSTMQTIKEENVKLLMDEKSKFLMHGDSKGLSSLQYPTVGLGVRDFATNAIPLVVGLPMYTISSISAIVNVGAAINFTTSIITFGLVGGSLTVMYAFGKAYYFYETRNQKIENNLVGKVGFIEAHREAVSLMGALDSEYTSVVQELDKVTSTIPKLSIISFSNFTVVSTVTSVASQFLGGYYRNELVPSLDSPQAMVLNVMLTLFVSNMLNVVQIMTINYAYTKLNLEELNALEKAYNDCLFVRNTNNKMQYEFHGDQLSIINFCVYKPNIDNTQNIELSTMFDQLNLGLELNKIYKLSGGSGSGKTTLLKAITNNWQYTDGTIIWPINAKNNLCFIPQDSFIPAGTLIEILTYPFKPQEFLKNYLIQTITKDDVYVDNEDEASIFMGMDIDISNGESVWLFGTDDTSPLIDISPLISRVKLLLEEVNLLPNVIKGNEIESETIKWNERLSGGEKQKIGIIRALLTGCPFIIMDEATSALDLENKHTVSQVVKRYVSELENYMIIYTEHGFTKNFADVILKINGENLDYYEAYE